MNSEWVSLKDAAQILGVHPATIRNWADQGDLPSQRTPGGHRRFRRADLERFAVTQGVAEPAPPDTEAAVLVQNTLGRTRIEIGGGHLGELAWYRDLSQDTKDSMARLGRQLMEALRQYLAAPGAAPTEAVELGLSYGKLIQQHGLTLGQAIQGFFTFNDLLFDSIAQIGELNHSNQREALRRAYVFTREMLLAVVKVYEP